MRICWTIYMSIVLILWYFICFSTSFRDKECHVIELSDGTYEHTVLTVDSDDVTDVAHRFRFLASSWLIHAIISLIACLYHLAAIYCFDALLTWRHFVSRFNKLTMLYGFFLIIMTHAWRLDSAGRICSGSDLTS